MNSNEKNRGQKTEKVNKEVKVKLKFIFRNSSELCL